MKLLIITSKDDSLSYKRIAEEAEKKEIKTLYIFYEDLKNINFEKLKNFDFCILRYPYSKGKNYPTYLRKILKLYKNKILNQKLFEKYPFKGKELNHPEDKLTQHKIFKDNMPKLSNTKSFPIVVKKRVSQKCRDVFIFKTKEELKKFLKNEKINDYLIEEYIRIKKDIRVLVLNNNVIGSVDRNVRIKEKKGYIGIGVKINKKFNLPEKIKKDAIKASKIIKSDFCGIDFIIDKNNKHYLIECNLSPCFISTERILGINIAKKIIDFILEK